MAGMIKVRPGELWSTSGWMFDFVMRSIAADATDPRLKESLAAIEENNFGWLSLPDLPETQRTEVERVIRDHLVARAERDLPADMPERAGVVDYIRGLADAIAGTPVSQVPGQAPRHTSR
jgi:hypothetical protein